MEEVESDMFYFTRICESSRQAVSKKDELKAQLHPKRRNHLPRIQTHLSEKKADCWKHLLNSNG